MNRAPFAILALLFSGLFLLAAADNAIVGTWDLVSDSPDGEQYKWTLTVKEESGKLSGVLTGSPGQFPLADLRMDGNTFTCKVTVEGQTYTVEAKISGTKLDGTWKGSTSQGFLKGSKQT